MTNINEPWPAKTDGKIVRSRPAQDDDYEDIRRLLLETVSQTPPGLNWDIRRLEAKKWYDPAVTGDPDWYKNGRIWQTDKGQIVGLAQLESNGFLHIQIHPDYRHLEPEMFAWGEIHFSTVKDVDLIHFFVYEYDIHRQRILEERGYQKKEYGGVTYNMRFGRQPLTHPHLANGYTLRTTNPEDDDDAQQIADLLNAAFDRSFHNPQEYQQFTRNATCFVPELDLVAVDQDGRFAAYVGIPYDEFNRRGIFEPVCTHPEHQKRALAKTLMQEGMRRLRERGAIDVVVETGNMVAANRLYTRMGFTEKFKGFYWSLRVGGDDRR